MPPKAAPRNWNDVQTAIATVAIVTTLGMWNLFSAPDKKDSTQQVQPPPLETTPTPMPQVTIYFTPRAAPQPAAQQQPRQQQPVTRNNNKQNNGGGGGPVTTTKTS